MKKEDVAGKMKYKTLLGTPTNVPPSKNRQYHIDAYKKGKASLNPAQHNRDDFEGQKSYKHEDK